VLEIDVGGGGLEFQTAIKLSISVGRGRLRNICELSLPPSTHPIST